MFIRRYCTACGDKLKPVRRRLFSHSLCAVCAPQSRASRLALVGLCILVITISFVIGRLSLSQKPITLIGTQLETPNLESFTSRQSMTGQQPATAPATKTQQTETFSLCGAPTKAGHSCRRKVKDWGYCYQHRDKYGRKPLPPEKKAEPQPTQNSTN